MAGKQAKIFLLFNGFLSVTHTLLFSHFHAPSLKGMIKRGRLKPSSFLTMTTMQAKIFLLFYDYLSFTTQSYVLSLMLPIQKQLGSY